MEIPASNIFTLKNSKIMKQYNFISLLFLFLAGLLNAQVIIGDSLAGAPAILEVGTSNKGLLVPRISISDLTVSSPVSNPKTGLLVVNTNATSGEGLVQWNGTKWQKLSTNKDVTNYIASLGVERVYFVGVTSGQTSAVNTDVVLQMNTLVLNNGSVSNNIYTIPTTGLYEISANWRASSVNSVNSYFILKIKSNGTLVAESTFSQPSALTNLGTKKVYLGQFNQGDQITYTIFRSTGASYTSSGAINIKKID